MRLLDLFCGAGGAAMGYHRAGFEVVGVDINPQPHYPFEFVQADAIEYVNKYRDGFDVFHASPPCQAYTWGTRKGREDKFPRLLGYTRDALCATWKPYVIENVPGAKKYLREPIMLCGTMFGLRVLRHRYFELRPRRVLLTPPCAHNGTVPNGDYITVAGRGGDNKRGNFGIKVWQEAMGIGWMTHDEITQAIPPAYTEFIGKQLMKMLENAP